MKPKPRQLRSVSRPDEARRVPRSQSLDTYRASATLWLSGDVISKWQHYRPRPKPRAVSFVCVVCDVLWGEGRIRVSKRWAKGEDGETKNRCIGRLRPAA